MCQGPQNTSIGKKQNYQFVADNETSSLVSDSTSMNRSDTSHLFFLSSFPHLTQHQSDHLQSPCQKIKQVEKQAER